MKSGSDNQIRKTAAQWAADTKVNLEGCKMYDTTNGWFKIADGVNTYANITAIFKPEEDLSGGGGGTTQYPQGAKLTANTADATNDGTQLSFDNAANINLATEVYVGQNGVNGTFTDLWASLANGGKISVVDTVNDAACEFNVTAAVDSGTYWTLMVSYLWGAVPNDGAAVYVLGVPGAVLGPKKYVALLTQSGTDAPVATVLENTLGGEVVWTRTGVGTYEGTLASAFGDNSTVVISGDWSAGDAFVVMRAAVTTDVINITTIDTTAPADYTMTRTLVQVTVYP